jgi:hypothetical protein
VGLLAERPCGGDAAADARYRRANDDRGPHASAAEADRPGGPSETDRAKAERIEARLKRRFPGQPVGVLRSDDYYGLRAGYWVPYVGPFSDTEEGRKAAQAAHAKVPGSIIGTIRHR